MSTALLYLMLLGYFFVGYLVNIFLSLWGLMAYKAYYEYDLITANSHVRNDWYSGCYDNLFAILFHYVIIFPVLTTIWPAIVVIFVGICFRIDEKISNFFSIKKEWVELIVERWMKE